MDSPCQFEDYEIGFVSGRVASLDSSTIPMLEPAAPSALAPRGDDGERSSSSAISLKPVPLPRSTLIGDLKLTALKARISTLGISAEFMGEGVLVCGSDEGGLGEQVAVRKVGRGQVRVEGPACDVYYAVRKEIYGLHALIAA
jgi:cleavage and polyadenylation specificity factor subunit 2